MSRNVTYIKSITFLPKRKVKEERKQNKFSILFARGKSQNMRNKMRLRDTIFQLIL